jgi:hypothetical protein
VTNVTVATVSDTSAVITWTTDQNSDNVVEYGLSAAYGSGATNSSFLYFHTLPVGGLSPNTTYHFRAVSRNASSQASASADYVFTTLAAAVPDLIIDDGNVVYGGAWSVGRRGHGYFPADDQHFRQLRRFHLVPRGQQPGDQFPMDD